MPEYLSPGVYIEEVDTGNKPIEGVSTSTVGFVGPTERGPVTPMLITSYSEFTRMYGRYVANSYLPYGVEGFFQNGGKRCFIARVASSTAATASIAIGGLTIAAIGPGAWPNGRLAVNISNAGLHDPNSAPTQNLFKLTIIYWDASVGPLPTPLVDPTNPDNLMNPNRREPTIVEQFDNVSPDSLSSSFVERLVNGSSMLVTVTLTGGARPGNTASLQTPTNGGNGGNLVINDFAGDPAAQPGNKRGLAALEEIDEIAILSCPDEHALPNALIAEKLVEQCERLKDRFAILQSRQQAGPINTLRPYRVSKYAAFYYPWITITDPVTDQPRDIPPSGHIAGIYARTDIERGVHKAPANEVIRGLFFDPVEPTAGLQFNIVKGQQDFLNPRGVNVLRYFPGRGNLVWGARTSTLDPDWRYINVRRLFIFVEESIEEATQWVVFEPNDEPTWARVRRAVGAFLGGLWRDGMLQGRTAEEAYFVRCDRTTMTQADIDNGKLIVLIGIAPVKPAEFVIFRIGQWAGGSEVTEG
jgi:uncharacterized protein